MTGSTSIADLPLALREQIVERLTPLTRSIRVKPTLRHRERLYQAIPSELLAPAQSSPIISIAVASVLGLHECYLTRYVAQTKLADWIHALAPHVQAAIFYDPSLVDPIGHMDRNVGDPNESKPQNYDAKDLPSSMQSQNPWAHYMSLTLLMYLCSIMISLEICSTTVLLSYNASKLRELELPVSKDCARALDEVRLPALEVAAFDFRVPKYRMPERADKPWMRDMARMLRAFQKSGGDVKGCESSECGT